MTISPTQLQASADQVGKVKVVAGYALQQRLGSGSFATVYKGVKVNSSDVGEACSNTLEGMDIVAIKAITRTSDKLTKKVLENLEMEISILRNYRHPNIVCLHDVQKTERHFFLILEYCGGGDLQRLIRTRKAGRLSETLSRRLMRDLASGLKFLWSQELIHRDIKPQNLLITGPLPLDEIHDPDKLDANEEIRQEADFPSSKFALKIADFGFARHLQTASLAETLCGSPLYMAPEILQHQRYDAKADLWSVGTVLFEMIAGKPPFNGENHIDLLRNIQRKAVRLPNDVRVSKECVNLLRILLNRNPLCRAGFNEFVVACDAFVALGCAGMAPVEAVGTSHQPTMKMDLGTIHEDLGATSVMTTSEEQNQMSRALAPSRASPPRTMESTGMATPPFGPMTSPTTAIVTPPLDSRQYSRQNQSNNSKFAPLQPSPPQSSVQFNPSNVLGPSIPNLADSRTAPGQIQLTTFQQANPPSREATSLQQSTDDSEFVMVEHGTTNRSDSSSPSSSIHNRLPKQNRGEYMVVNDARSSSGPLRGMLGTSPGTGGMLVNLMGMGSRPRVLHQNSSNMSSPSVDSQIESASKMIAAAEDVGRRAISVAHLGDTRAYLAMRCLIGLTTGSSLLSAAPMEGVEKSNDEHSSANVTNYEEGSSHSTEVTGQARKRTSSSTDRSMDEAKAVDDDEEEMPFAIAVETAQIKDSSFVPIPSRSGNESLYRKNSIVASKADPKFSPQLVRLRFGEALTSYLKSLSMIKCVLGAVQKVKKDVEYARGQGQMSIDQAKRVEFLVTRCDTTTNWLSGQFTGVLERADAANAEISKFPVPASGERTDTLPVTSATELIYNHSLACGRDAAVKQLLGQFEAARSCYRTAGLLAETLLMEPNVGADDRKILEGYVDGFSARITALDFIILQQSRRSLTSSAGTAKKGSGVIGIIGGIQPLAPGFDSVLPPLRSPIP